MSVVERRVGVVSVPLGVGLAFAYLSLVWGSTYAFIKIVTLTWPPLLAGSVRNGIAGLLMLLVILLLSRTVPREWRGWWPPLVFGLINGTAFALIFWGQPRIPSGQSAVLVSTMPLFSLFLGRWWLGEVWTWRKLAAVGVGMVGVFVATTQREGVGFTGSELDRFLGQIAMLGAALFYAASYVFGKKFFRADIYVLTAIHLLTSATYLLVLSLLFDGPGDVGMFELSTIGALLYLAIPGSAVAYWCMFYLMDKLGSVQMAYVTVVNPIVAVLFGAFFLSEGLTFSMAAGTTLVALGVWLLARARVA